MHSFPSSRETPQPIHPGSYVYVQKRIRQRLRSVTLECWIKPWNLDRLQGLISQEDKQDARGLALGLGPGGYIGFFLGDGVSPDEAVIHRTKAGILRKLQWHHVVALWDGQAKEVWVDGQLVERWAFIGECLPGPHPIRLAAMSDHGKTAHLLDGDLAMPVIYQRALGPAEIRRRFSEKGQEPAIGNEVLGCWRLNEERGDRVADASPALRHGRIINHATWMIGGPQFDATKVGRYAHYDPSQDTTRGHGLRFASDDLYDCRWRPTHRWRVPSTARPGIYTARINYEQSGKSQSYHVTFLVRHSPSKPKPPILVVCCTSTWLAYNATPFCENIPPGTFLGTEGYKNSHPEAPAFSCYLNHHSGQPSYQFGLRMPWPCASPYILYSSPETGYSHLMRGERFLHTWLEQSRFEFDVISDLDLHRDPDAARGYKTVILNGHSEYWSIEAYEGLDRYLSAGGTAVVLSGNTLFWRTTFSGDGAIMECRKFDERIGGRGGSAVGELFHSHDQRRGSLLRECGYPAWRLVGLECCGWDGVESRDAGVYHTELPDHFLFHHPEKVGVARGDTFGHAPGGQSKKAVGHEYDVRLSTLTRMTPRTPTGTTLPIEPGGIVTLASGKRANQAALDYFTQPTQAPDGIVAEMIYWERPQGGRVFHAGAIGAGWSLSVDPKLQALMRNVLHAFGVNPAQG